MKLVKLIGCFVPCGAAPAPRMSRELEAEMTVDIFQHLDRMERLPDDFGQVLNEIREEQAELDQLFPELRTRSPWERAKEAIIRRRRRSAAKVAPLTADDEVITLGPALTRLFISQGDTQILEEIESRNQAIRQYYAS